MTGSVAIVSPFLNRWYFSEVVTGAVLRLDVDDYPAVVRLSGARGTGAATLMLDDLLERDEVVGAIAVGLHLPDHSTSRLRERGKPIAGVGGAVLGIPTSMIDDVSAARRATRHLIELGHERIGFLSGNLVGQLDFAVHARRFKGYGDAMAQADLESSMTIEQAEFSFVDGQRAAAALLGQRDRPTAVLAVSDEMAFAVLTESRAAGLRVPDDLSVIGIDDHPSSEALGLTTVRQDPAALGSIAADLVLRSIRGEAVADEPVRQETELVVRSSTAPPS